MNIVDQIYMGLIYVWSNLDKTIVGAMVTSVIVAVLRMKKAGKVQWAEALLCGIFCMIALLGLSFIGSLTGIVVPAALAESASPFIAGAIGWYGTARTVQFLEDKVGKDDINNKEL